MTPINSDNSVENHRHPASDLRFDGIRNRLLAQGQLPPDLTAGHNILLAGSRSGVGVTTLTIGLADSCARASAQPILAILQGAGDNDAPQTGDPSFAPIQREPSQADILSFRGTDSDETNKLLSALPRFKSVYGMIFLDGGSLEDSSFSTLGRGVQRRWLVVDLRNARRSELATLGRDLDRLTVKFDGFIANRLVDQVPGPLAQMTS